MTAETVGRLAANGRIIGIKEACGNADRVGEIKRLVPDDFILLSGEDAQTLSMMQLGAVGTVSVTANVVPRQMAQFCERFLAGDVEGAESIDSKLQPVHEILFVETSPIPTKWALHMMGRIGTGIRLPLTELSARHREAVRDRLDAFGALP